MLLQVVLLELGAGCCQGRGQATQQAAGRHGGTERQVGMAACAGMRAAGVATSSCWSGRTWVTLSGMRAARRGPQAAAGQAGPG